MRCVTFLRKRWHGEEVKAGRVSVMHWAMFCLETLGPSIRVDFILKYISINTESDYISVYMSLFI